MNTSNPDTILINLFNNLYFKMNILRHFSLIYDVLLMFELFQTLHVNT